jgi:hypothetical protein
MAFQEVQIDIINNWIRKFSFCDPMFTADNVSLNGIAYDSNEEDKTFPVVNTLKGDGTAVSLNDTYAIQLYHRILKKEYSYKKAQFGNDANMVTEKMYVKLVVAGNTQKLQLIQEDVEALIAANFPGNIPQAVFNPDYAPMALESMMVTLTGSNLTKEQVFKEEYKGVPYSAKPYQILFCMNYYIESTYKKGCFSILNCQTEQRFDS